MAIRPAKVIYGLISGTTVVETWDYDDGTGDPWIGLPYKYQFSLNITAQPHGSHVDGNDGAGFFYTGRDIRVGDWVFSSGGARILLITRIVDDSDPNNIVVEALDDDRVNVANDYTQLGQAGIPEGDCYVFEAKSGIPALYPLPPNLPGPIPPQSVAEIISRFAAMRKDVYIDVVQPDHGFVVGQAITLGPDGLYYPSTNVDDRHVSCGVVVELVNTANGPTKFRFLPVGPVVENITLTGDLGALFYLDSSVPGGVTQEPESAFAQPAFIKLSDASAILLNSAAQPDHALQHAGLDTLYLSGLTEYEWNLDETIRVKREYRKTGSTQRHMFTTTFVWGADGALSRKNVLRIPDGKILQVDYLWNADGTLHQKVKEVI